MKLEEVAVQAVPDIVQGEQQPSEKGELLTLWELLISCPSQ